MGTGLGAAIGAGVLAACSSGTGATGTNETTQGAAAEPATLRTGVKVTVLNDINQATAPFFDQLLTAWKAAHPGTDVDWIRPQGAVSLTAMVAAGTPPDVFSLGQDDFAAYANSGEELVLDDYVKRDHFDTAGFFPASVEMAKQKGKQFGFPRAFNCGTVYTNVSAFDQAGVPQPPLQWGGPKWGWAEFQDAAKRLSVSSDDPKQAKFGADLLMNNFFWSFVWANHPRYPDVQKVLDEELAPVWQQGVSVQTATDAIKRRVDPILQGR